MKRLNSVFYILISIFMFLIAYEIISDKAIKGSRGAPDLYLGNYSYLIGAIFIIYGIYILYYIKKEIFKIK